ncbi:MAG: cardiolipin synthase [Verrucomicrobia bacterium A1]|nr:MAG: cardiolipin synthase [Verrucomicrobia bacterium A1]
MTQAAWLTAAAALHGAACVIASLHAIRIKREASSALLWLLVIWSFPGAGVLLYVVLGVDRIAAKTAMRVDAHKAFRNGRRARESDSLPMDYWFGVRDGGVAEPVTEWGRALNRSLDPLLPDFPLLGGNRVEPLVTGDEAYGPMLDAIRGARRHINLQTFILSNDAVGREFLDLLVARAREGVEVRLLFDRFGSTPAVLSGFVRRYRGVSPAFRIAGWTQAMPLRRQFQMNLRNHRKILVVDGTTAFTGGINLAALNVSRPGTPAHRDFHFRIEGPAVQELQFSFLSDWHFMTGESAEALLIRDFFPGCPRAGDARVRIVNGEPALETETLPDVIFSLLVAARRQVLVLTPYFVPTADLIRAFRAAALRGVEVKLLVPRENNHVYAGWAGRSFYGSLLEAGVRIFERAPPFMHAKALIVDDEVATVGSANLDSRSLRLNYETNLLVYDTDFINRLKQAVLDEFAHGEEIDAADWRTRSALRRFAENACALLSPVL